MLVFNGVNMDEKELREKLIVVKPKNETKDLSKEDRSVKHFLKQKDIFVNLMVMSFTFTCASFSFYMISTYVKYLPGDIY